MCVYVVCVCVCVCVFCVCDTKNYLHSGLKRGFFSLLINIQCERFVSILSLSLSFGFSALVIYASFPTSLLPTIPPHFHHFLTRILFQSHSLILATHSRVGSGTRVSYEHSSRGNHRYFAQSAGFHLAFVQTDDVGGKIRAPFVEKSLRPRPPGSRFTKSKSPLDRDGPQGKELARSLGTRQSNSEGAIRGGSRRKREANPVKHYDENRCRQLARGTYTRGGGGNDGLLAPRDAVTNNTRSFGQNRCTLQRKQIGLYVYE